MNYLLHILVLLAIDVPLVLSLTLMAGYGGSLSVAHAAYFGVGGYFLAILTTRFGWTVAAALLLVPLTGAVLGAATGAAAARLRGDYFVLYTLGAQVLFVGFARNMIPVTGGPFGITEIPRPLYMGQPLYSLSGFALFAIIVALVCIGIIVLATLGPSGLAARAARADPMAALALGIAARKIRFLVVALSCAVAASSGALYATYFGFVGPDSFGVGKSILLVAAALLGGAGNVQRGALSACFVVVLPELLRFLQLPSQLAAEFRSMLFGLFLLLVLLARPGNALSQSRRRP